METWQFCLLKPTQAMRLDAIVAQLCCHASIEAPRHWSRAQVQFFIKSGAIRIAALPVKSSRRWRGGEWIVAEVPPPRRLALIPQCIHLNIVYEDAHCVVINKPAGLLVHPGHTAKSTLPPPPTLVEGMLWHCNGCLPQIGGVARPGIVHRLDQYTSGLLVVAKTNAMHHHLAQQFARAQVQKHYVALVHGIPNPAQATLRTHYGRHPRHRKRFTGRLGQGKWAETSYQVWHHTGLWSILRLRLHTGRTHQLRVHCAEMQHPIVGDQVYGRSNDGMSRQALHAYSLGFSDLQGAWRRFFADWPTDIQQFWHQQTGQNLPDLQPISLAGT